MSGSPQVSLGATCRAGKVFSDVIVRNRFHNGGQYTGERFIGSFEDGLDGWEVEGEAVTNHGQHAVYEGQQRIAGNVGSGFLTSYHPSKGDKATGRALSPESLRNPTKTSTSPS